MDKETLPIATTTDPKKTLNSEEYVVYENVPVFREHERTLRTGRILSFGKKELQKVVDRSNKRIETNDFCPIVIGHNVGGAMAEKPPIVGYAGPFRLGWLNKDKKNYCILADFRIKKEMDAECRKYPRRSAEIWVEDNYDDIYIDPIALLGADTPYSDLGLMYGKQDENGVQRLCYMAAPVATGALNCYVPGSSCCGEEKREKEKYSMDVDNPGNTLNQVTQEQMNVAQIVVRAIEQAPWCQFVKRLMEAEARRQNEPTVEGNQEPQGIGAQNNPSVAQEETDVQEDEIQASEVPDEENFEEPGEDEPPQATESDPQELQNQKPANAPTPSSIESTPTNPTQEDETLNENKSDVPTTPEAASPEESDGTDDYGEEPDESNLEGESNMSEINELSERLDALENENRQLKLVVRKLVKEGTDKARYSKLEALSRDRVFNLEEEFQRCCYEKMEDDKFEEHVASIKANYRATPTAIDLPNGLIQNAAQDDASRPGRVMYSKEKNVEIEAEVMRRGIANSQSGTFQSAEEIRRQVEQEFFGGKQ